MARKLEMAVSLRFLVLLPSNYRAGLPRKCRKRDTGHFQGKPW